jgi:membrane dipeptidase
MSAPSSEALALCRSADIIDLHIDSFILPRIWPGYDLLARHRGGPLGRWFFGHLDLPRALEAGLTGGMWSITTNPFRGAKGRWRTFQRNLQRFQALLDRSRGAMALARSAGDYARLRERGAHAVFLSVQGANAFSVAPDLGEVAQAGLVRATLVHLTNSVFGATSSPAHLLRRHKGLSPAGERLVEMLDHHRIFVDLAHIHPVGFWRAVELHQKELPLIVTHTGVSGVQPHWRNLDDQQIRAIADSGGVVGIIFSELFLRRRGGPSDMGMVAEHLEHVRKVGGAGAVAIGSDYDGAITPPPDLGSVEQLPALVDCLLRRGWTEPDLRGALGLNFLRALGQLRG